MSATAVEKNDSPWKCRRCINGFLLMVACGLVLSAPLRSHEHSPTPYEPPDSLEAHVGKGYELIQTHQYLEASKEFLTALTLNPSLVRVRYQLALCYFALKQWKDAREQFERLNQETKGDPRVTYYLGRLDLLEERTDSAIGRLARIASSPPFPDTPYYLGAAYLKSGELKSAENQFKLAAKLAPRDFRVPDHLARVYMKTGRRSDAEGQFKISAALRERYNVGTEQAIDCNQAFASQPAATAVSICQKLFDPDDPDKLVTLALIYGNRRLYTESLDPLERAAGLDPDSFEIQHDLGLSYFRLGRYSEAREPLERAVALRPDYFGSNALLGATLFALNDDAAGFRILSHAHQLDPGDGDVKELLFKLSVRLGHGKFLNKDYAGCLSYLQEAARLHPEDREVHLQIAEVSRLMREDAQAKH